MSRQDPLPTFGGAVRFGRTAAAGAKQLEVPDYTRGRSPMTWTVTVDPDTILIHVWVPGDPQPWERAITTKAKIGEDGQLKQGHSFTPGKTRQAETIWKVIMRRAKLTAAPYPGPVGMRLDFRCAPRPRGGNPGDWDNLGKLISDAGNGLLYVDDRQVIEPYLSIRHDMPNPGTNLLVWRL